MLGPPGRGRREQGPRVLTEAAAGKETREERRSSGRGEEGVRAEEPPLGLGDREKVRVVMGAGSSQMGGRGPGFCACFVEEVLGTQRGRGRAHVQVAHILPEAQQASLTPSGGVGEFSAHTP